MSTIQTRNKMADKRHENQFYLVANAQLFDSSEQTEVSPMSTMAVNITGTFHQNHWTYNILTKPMQFVLMIIANKNSETSMTHCWFDFAWKCCFSR